MDSTTKRRVGLALALVAITGVITFIEAPWETGGCQPVDGPAMVPAHAAGSPEAYDFACAQTWLNSDEGVDLSQAVEEDKVVLVDFWTYSCRNCINTFPYLRAWHDAYEDDGLVIVGVHTPEFRFERNVANVQDATERYGLEYPVAIDNDYDIWNAYHNRFWPAKYLIDQYGRIQYTHFGEGAYNETEDTIRELLTEAGREPNNAALHLNAKQGYVAASQTPELFASHLNGYKDPDIGNEEGYHPGRNVTYAQPEEIQPDRIYLTGTWYNADEYVRAETFNATVTLSFKAGGANFVANDMNGTCIPVRLEGEPIPEDLAGPDVTYTQNGPCIRLDADRAFDYYNGPFARHTVELDVPVGFELYSFAFSKDGREEAN